MDLTSPRLFVSHRALESGLGQGVVTMDAGQLCVSALPDLRWDLTPGVVFESVQHNPHGDPEAVRLVGQMRSSDELDEAGADHFGTVVVVNDVQFEVLSGFVVSFSDSGAPLPQLIFAWGQLSDALSEPALHGDAERRTLKPDLSSEG